jgi:hypothetical protein
MDAGAALNVAVNPFAAGGVPVEEQNEKNSRHESGQDCYPIKIAGIPLGHTFPL